MDHSLLSSCNACVESDISRRTPIRQIVPAAIIKYTTSLISSVVSFIYLLSVLGFWPSSVWISKWPLHAHCCRLLFAWWICWVGAAIVFKPGQGRSAFLGRSWSTPFVFEGASSRLVKPLGWGLPSKCVWGWYIDLDLDIMYYGLGFEVSLLSLLDRLCVHVIHIIP